MAPDYQIITREIPAKGKGYIIIRKCGPDQVAQVLRRAASELLGQGASLIYAASIDPAAPLVAGEGYTLEHAHDMLGMERSLADPDRPRPEGRLTLEPLTRAKGGAWLCLLNESFFDVPNSSTNDEADLRDFLEGPYRCGFALLDGAPVGVYECGFKKESPEIGSIGLSRDFRGRGLGRELLLSVMELLAGLGYEKCWLQVSTANEAAYPLYQSVGVTLDRVLSRWYQVISQGDLRA